MEVDHNKIRCNGQTSLTPHLPLPLILGDNEDNVVGLGWLGAMQGQVGKVDECVISSDENWKCPMRWMREARVSPTLSELANALKDFATQSLSKIVSLLLLSVDLDNLNSTSLDIGPEEMPLDQEAFGAIGKALGVCKQEGSIVVFKDLLLMKALM